VVSVAPSPLLDDLRSMPRRWLAIVLGVGLSMMAAAAAVRVARARRTGPGARVSREMVTGRAGTALSHSGTFAPSGAPASVHAVIPRVDAESAAVAMGYWEAPSYPVVRNGEHLEKPLERRHVCWRSYYVRPVVALPADSIIASDVTSDFVGTWGAAWVVPICDDAGVARTTVLLADAPTRLRVLLGDQPGDVPRLARPTDGPARINFWPTKLFPELDRGVGIMPESAVTTAVAGLAGTGARVAEVPEAFTMVIRPRRSPNGTIADQSMPQAPMCARWRLTLDRPVELRGIASGQVTRTATVYVARTGAGCSGAASLEIPLAVQPSTLPFWYGVRPGWPRDTVLRPVEGRPMKLPDPQMRSIRLRVTEPVWFEEARLAR
jgi:hypothetical protein